MRKIKSLFNLILAFVMTLTLFTGCEEAPAPVQSRYSLYYINSSITGIVQESYPGDDPTIESLILALQGNESSEGNVLPLKDISLLTATLTDTRLTLDMGREYGTLSGVRETLTRAAVVKTLTQLSEVTEVEMLVAGNPLTYPSGEVIGAMNSSDFVEYFGREQEELLSGNFVIYYVADDNESLIAETRRYYYNVSVPLEQEVLKFMQEEPLTEGAKVALAPGFNYINITTTDGVCYLDMDMSFYNPEGSIPYNLAIAAIVNSLCELGYIHSVRISIIEGTDGNLSELAGTISGTYQMNTEVVRE